MEITQEYLENLSTENYKKLCEISSGFIFASFLEEWEIEFESAKDYLDNLKSWCLNYHPLSPLTQAFNYYNMKLNAKPSERRDYFSELEIEHIEKLIEKDTYYKNIFTTTN